MTARLGAALSALVLALAAVPAQAAHDVFAHRGGAYVRGKPLFPENALPAFGVAALQRDPLEFDMAALSAFDDRGNPAVGRQSITLG